MNLPTKEQARIIYDFLESWAQDLRIEKKLWSVIMKELRIPSDITVYTLSPEEEIKRVAIARYVIQNDLLYSSPQEY